MFHVVAFEEAVGTTDDTDLDAITDDILSVQNSHFFPGRDLDLVFAAYCGATANRARLVTPKLRQITPPVLQPVNAAATFGADPIVEDYRLSPLRLRMGEEIAVEGTSDIAMGTEQSYAVLGLSPGLRPAPRGDFYALRGTSTTAAVANKWQTLDVTWADSLPQGTYAVVGLNVVGVTEVAARLIFNDQIWRPGCLGSALVGNKVHPMFRNGGLGEWGRFRNDIMPRVQVLNVSTTAVHSIILDIVQVSA